MSHMRLLCTRREASAVVVFGFLVTYIYDAFHTWHETICAQSLGRAYFSLEAAI